MNDELDFVIKELMKENGISRDAAEFLIGDFLQTKKGWNILIEDIKGGKDND